MVVPDGWSGRGWSNGTWHKALMKWKSKAAPSSLRCVVQCGESRKQLQLRVIKISLKCPQENDFSYWWMC